MNQHNLRKAFRVLRLCINLFKANMFGKYVHTVGAGNISYHIYEYRGEKWFIPAGPMTEE